MLSNNGRTIPLPLEPRAHLEHTVTCCTDVRLFFFNILHTVVSPGLTCLQNAHPPALYTWMVRKQLSTMPVLLLMLHIDLI